MHAWSNHSLAVVCMVGSLALCACAGSSAQPELTDAKTPPPTLTCEQDAGATPWPIELVPVGPPDGPGVFLPYQIGAACKALGLIQVLLQNTSAAAIQIDAVGISDPRFSVTAAGLPQTLAAGTSYPIGIDFHSSVPGDASAMLIASGPDGCTTFPLSAVAVDAKDEGVLTFFPEVIDFGRVPAGTASAVQKLTVLVQPRKSSAGSRVEGFGASPGEFEIVDTKGPTNVGKSCRRFEVSVRFHAPVSAGTVRGTIGWSVSTRIDQDLFEAVVVVELIGTAVAQ